MPNPQPKLPLTLKAIVVPSSEPLLPQLVLLLSLVASAKVDYADVAYLGGGSMVDLNNANVRAYLRMPGMYPSAAGKIVTHGPYKSVGDVYNIPGLTQAEKDVIKNYENRFTVKDPAAEYVIDRINNGLYNTVKISSLAADCLMICL